MKRLIRISALTRCCEGRVLVKGKLCCRLTKVSIGTVDTDVLVLAVRAAQHLNITEFWIGFGTGKSSAALEMVRAPGPDLCLALPMFDAFTGCDMV